MRFAMAIDTTRCIGCYTCAVACKMSNNLPNDVWWNTIHTDGGDERDTAAGEYPNNLRQKYYPVSCQHCASPTCVEVCPTGATYKREDGLVVVDAEACIGCNSCVPACPYGARTLLPAELTWSVDFAVGDADAAAHIAGTATKCTGCAHRIDRDEKPACMELCPGRARHWGDLDDPESDISKFLADKEYTVLLESAGTEPSCFYIV